MLVAHLVDLLAKRTGIRIAAAPFTWLLNAAGETIDGAVPLLRETVPGSLTANYHVEAVA
jgi:hypothetical protein